MYHSGRYTKGYLWKLNWATALIRSGMSPETASRISGVSYQTCLLIGAYQR